MANSQQAKKRVLQAEFRTLVNQSRRSRIKTYVRRVEEAVQDGSGTNATQALRKAESEVMRGVTKGVINKNTARRKISRLAKKVKAAT